MNCRRIEKLILLYVEGDLQSKMSDRVASHLDWCSRCNRLADEYKESQSWLRSSTLPEFEKALLDSVKNDVLIRIAASNRKSSPLALLAQHCNRRQVLALSAALLLIFGMVVISVYQARVKINSTREIATKERRDETTQPTSASYSKPAPGAVPRKPHRLSPNRRRFLARDIKAPIVNQGGGQVLSHADGLAETRAPRQQVENLSSFENSKEMLRIEIQTSDPNIRIIWFVPKETDSHQLKPTTD